jgi:DNA-binding transcriptional MerR regulator
MAASRRPAPTAAWPFGHVRGQTPLTVATEASRTIHIESRPIGIIGLMGETLGIGEVARRTGKAPSAIRYYEEIGLLSAPARISGQRRYHAAVVRTLAVIETAQRAGLTLEEIRLLRAAAPAAAGLRQLAERKLPEVQALIERAEIVRGWLECAADCECPTLDDCPLFDEPDRLPARRTSAG